MTDALTYINPTRPPAPYIGGKSKLAKRIIGMIDDIPHTVYAEPFVGMGGIFFRRRRVPKAEFINDRSGDVATFFRVLQRHYPQFIDTLKFQITGRREFERLRRTDPDTLTDLERAARFLYLQRISYGGKVEGRVFGISFTRGARFNLTTLAPMLEEVHERLAGVTIDNLDWAAFIDRYDREGTLFYLDPPYYGVEDYYGRTLFDRGQFSLMADRLSRLKGRFILSLNDVPEVREIFSAFKQTEVKISYSCGARNGMAGHELIITGH